ncbi:hypothetical protein GCU56_03925 [Geodermatophilus sabuli]|uniref:Uncharacterized protein n=1 Tax=Geodermatophilus sabuli TaxID=1564158 RepID=A0A7K3VXA0_9ACTN|nr:hypothetical protein [Geodermatophilus sabuli]NEK57020.1 hypothetical protein [Geodermatophilus sabuli]
MSDRELESPSGRRTPGLTRCGSHAPGHAPHPARVQLCRDDAAEHWEVVIVMGAVDDVVTLALGADLQRWRNHDAAHLAAQVRDCGPAAFLNTRLGLLFLRAWPRDQSAVFSLQPAEHPAAPCRS